MTIQQLSDAIKSIKALYDVDVIKSHKISQLVDMNTVEVVGNQVAFQLSTKFDYDNKTIEKWKSLLHADSWHINVLRNQLRIYFDVHNKNQK